jgi:hypothetical protein
MNFLETIYVSEAIGKTKETKERPLEDIRFLLQEFFGNRFDLEETGLNFKFRELKERVREDKLIGLVLYALKEDIPKENDFITKYTNPSRVVMKLTITSICKCLINDHIMSENIESLCNDLN